MILSQRIALRPNNVQSTWMDRCAGTARFAYNWGLARWREQFSAREKTNWRKLNAELNARKRVEHPWMLELPWAIPNVALADLGTAFKNFFRRVKQDLKPGYPRFKKKDRCREGFSIEARALTFNGKRVKLPKLGWVRTRQQLRFPGKIISARFSKRAGRWYVSLQVEVSDSWIYPHRCKTHAAVGVDLGVVDLAVLSTGERVEAPRALRRFGARLRRLDKELHRRKKGGSNRKKTQAKLTRLHERISNVRRDIAHKLTARLVERFRWIGVENLNVAGMMKNRRLAKSVSDAAMSEVLRQLAYKAPLAGSVIVQADRFYPSSKTCSACGIIYTDLRLGERRWTCNACDTANDRDDNGAQNLRTLAEAHSVTACRHGSAGAGHKTRVKLPLGQESSNLTVN